MWNPFHKLFNPVDKCFVKEGESYPHHCLHPAGIEIWSRDDDTCKLRHKVNVQGYKCCRCGYEEEDTWEGPI